MAARGQTSYYEMLGIESSVSQDAVSKAYRKRALQTHPDRGGNEAEFKKVAEAYETLSDPSRRKTYDRRLNGTYEPTRGSSSSSHGFRDGFSTNASTNAFDLFDELFPDMSFSRASTSARRGQQTMSSPFGAFGGSSLLNDLFPGGGDVFQSLSPSAPRRPSGSSRGSFTTSSGSSSYSSFTTSFGGASSSSSRSSSSSGGPRTGTMRSESRSTRIINGKREDIVETRDERGNVTVHKKRSDGTQSVHVNGVEQPSPPLLTRSNSKTSGRLPSSTKSSAQNGHHNSSDSGLGSAGRPIYVD